jgi:hypothetical protein
LGISGLLTYRKSGNSYFYFEFSSPLAAFVSRPQARILYKVLDPKFSAMTGMLHENMKFTSVNRHLALNTNVGYSFRRYNRFENRLFWRFSYIKDSLPYSKDVNILYHTFGLTFLF